MNESMDIDSSLEPGLLTESQLKTLIHNKGIRTEMVLTKEQLIQLYLKHVQPQPQRQKKNRNNPYPIQSGLQHIQRFSRQEKTTFGKETESNSSASRRIVLKRTLLIDSSSPPKTHSLITPNDKIQKMSISDEFNEEIKKFKLN